MTARRPITAPADPSEDLDQSLAALRQRRRALALEAELGDPAAATAYELVTRELETVQARIVRRDLAEVERAARAEAEAQRAHAGRRQALLDRIHELDAERQAVIRATESAWDAFASQLDALLAAGKSVYGALAALHFHDGREPRTGDHKLVGTEALARWLAWRLNVPLHPFVERPGAHFWREALDQVLATPLIPEEEGR